MNKKIKPVLRYAGSKYKKIDKIIDILKINKKDGFLDMFAGSGIVGVNVRNRFNNKVVINDFDNVLPVNDKQAMINICSFQGLGKSFTDAANKYAITRINNNYWDKVDTYNDVLKECKIIRNDWIKNSFLIYDLFDDGINKIYVDPPYDGIKNLYKNSFTEEDHISLKMILDSINPDKIKILISYNDTPFIRKLYNDWNIIEENFTYSTGGKTSSKVMKKVKELFITNYEIKQN